MMRIFLCSSLCFFLTFHATLCGSFFKQSSIRKIIQMNVVSAPLFMLFMTFFRFIYCSFFSFSFSYLFLVFFFLLQRIPCDGNFHLLYHPFHFHVSRVFWVNLFFFFSPSIYWNRREKNINKTHIHEHDALKGISEYWSEVCINAPSIVKVKIDMVRYFFSPNRRWKEALFSIFIIKFKLESFCSIQSMVPIVVFFTSSNYSIFYRAHRMKYTFMVFRFSFYPPNKSKLILFCSLFCCCWFCSNILWCWVNLLFNVHRS